MQKKILVGILFLMAGPALKAQDSTARLNSIRINPFSFIVANTSVFYERGITPRSSAMIGLNYFNAGIYKVPVTGYGISLEYRFHPGKRKSRTPDGFYLSPFLRYQDFSFSQPITVKDAAGKTILDISGGLSVSQYAAGAMVGYEAIGKRGFTFDIFFGPYYNTTVFTASVSHVISIPLYSVPISGFWVRGGMAFGYTF
jgi:hypothetical protein